MTASAAGARRISSPPCGRAPRPTAAITIQSFPTRRTSACGSRTCATSSPTSRHCRRGRARRATPARPSHFKTSAAPGGWKFLFLDGEQFKPDTSKPAPWNRGAYLVNGPGHCAECHSPRNRLGGIIAGKRFAGGPDPEGGDGWVPNITPAGIGDYSQRDIERVLETGDLPDGDSVGGPMAAVVANTSKLSAQDGRAIALSLKSLPPVEGPKRP